MTNQEQVDLLCIALSFGIHGREEHPNDIIGLGGADLNGANLNHANLSGVYLNDANLNYAHLNYANLSKAILIGADLINAHLNDADLSDADLKVPGALGRLSARTCRVPTGVRQRVP